MKKQQLLLLAFSLFASVSVFSQQIWTIHKDNSKTIGQELEYRASNPTTFEIYSINNDLIDKRLKIGVTTNFSKEENIIELPTPNGVQRFSIKEASVLSEELATKFPTIKSYSGIGIDDPTARVRLSKSQVGLHAMITSGNYPMYLIDPYTKDKNTAIAYYKKSSLKSEFECLVEENIGQAKQVKSQKTANANDGKLRTYKLALIATAEYSDFHLTNQGIGAGETDETKKAAVLAAMNTSVTRISGVFERDLGVAMQLVTNNADLIFLNPTTDGLTNSDIEALIDESQTKCDAVIGGANYDIGHVFAWVDDNSGNGLAGGGVVCDINSKAQGVSMKKSPIGDTFDIDLAAHEIGHQFGANHTQNGDCNRNNSTAVEPGSGSTIMGYAGFCDPEVQSNSDAYFHAVSIAEMWNYVSATATCAVETATNNAAPVANAGGNYTIPKSTPFVLKGSATDGDAGNSLTYNWEQTNNETATMPPVATNTVGPMFRSFSSTSSSNRYMPAIETVLAGNTSSTWEVLPSVARTLSFALTVRDNVANGAATDRDNTIITIDASSGPFIVTSQSTATTLEGGSIQTVTWDVANTTAGPVNCSHVNILLSTDGGLTFPRTFVTNTLNDGIQEVRLSNVTTSLARIKVEAVDNIFYAVNSTNFSIDKTAGVNDELFLNFSVYPNPSKGKITINFDRINSNDVVLKLFDIRGRMIDKKEYKITSSQFKKEVDYQAIAKGLYILKIENGENIISKKILID